MQGRVRLRVALFHGLPPGGALRALYEVLRHLPSDLEVDLFTADMAAVDRFSDLTEGTYRLDLSGSVAATRTYRLPAAVRLVAPHLGRHGAYVLGGEAMRPVQRTMARDINDGGYDVAFLHACRFSLSVPIAEWLKVPCVFYAQEARRVGFEAPLAPPSSQSWQRRTLVSLLRPPYELVCRRRDRHAVAAVDRVLCNSRFSADVLTAAYGIDPIVCYLGVDDSLFCPPDEASGEGTDPPDGTLRVLSVGALHPVKGHDLALRATAHAAAATSASSQLHVVYERERPGYGSELSELARDRSPAPPASGHLGR